MSYYASADGKITLARKMTDSEIHDVHTILDSFEDYVYGGEISIIIDKRDYEEDEVKNTFKTLTEYFRARGNSIVSAAIEWHGEDNEVWRHICYNDEWAEQIGYIEWGEENPF